MTDRTTTTVFCDRCHIDLTGVDYFRTSQQLEPPPALPPKVYDLCGPCKRAFDHFMSAGTRAAEAMEGRK